MPLANVVGTVNRPHDFDADFRLLNGCLRDRWEGLARAVEDGLEPPPVDLVQLGELYFVADGHHRVSVLRARGRAVVTARVRRICTVAYAMACLRAAHLASKAVERRFLERVPLAECVRSDLWLDEPADWLRLADAAEAWALRRTLSGRAPSDRRELAAGWWAEEVMPVLERLRAAGAGLDLRDVQLYVTALAARDRLGLDRWPTDPASPLWESVAGSPQRGSLLVRFRRDAATRLVSP
ncbi:hypothetical protein [Gandjariella thermophila]|uniref:ParB/Sulfiredoxin domain-containing protein n=1 Tax=Gandjariella thermophila TaxID=1931992 RepID=A0A4D4J4R0_9PSEU|nr:hypothetical protein [Gandjariella thermophila]GDY30062.1 hypothetical protein GTS_16950 [Gandjariella thermophila]